MWEALLKKIPQFLFEPVAVCAVLGLVVALIFNWKKRAALYYIILGAVSFMIAWRVGVKIIAARYSSILIIPGVIASSYLFFTVGDWLKKIPRLPQKVGDYFSLLVLVVIATICFFKVIHFNPYGNYIIKCGEAIKQDATKYQDCLIFSDDVDYLRYKYYIGMPVIGRYDFRNFSGNRKLLLINMLIKNNSNRYNAIYFICEEPTSRKAILGKELSVENSQWCLIDSQFQNRKKRKQLRVYRWTSLDISNSAIPSK